MSGKLFLRLIAIGLPVIFFLSCKKSTGSEPAAPTIIEADGTVIDDADLTPYSNIRIAVQKCTKDNSGNITNIENIATVLTDNNGKYHIVDTEQTNTNATYLAVFVDTLHYYVKENYFRIDPGNVPVTGNTFQIRKKRTVVAHLQIASPNHLPLHLTSVYSTPWKYQFQAPVTDTIINLNALSNDILDLTFWYKDPADANYMYYTEITQGAAQANNPDTSYMNVHLSTDTFSYRGPLSANWNRLLKH